jgi:hypothetical protein
MPLRHKNDGPLVQNHRNDSHAEAWELNLALKAEVSMWAPRNIVEVQVAESKNVKKLLKV